MSYLHLRTKKSDLHAVYQQENFLLILIHNTCITHVNDINKGSYTKC